MWSGGGRPRPGEREVEREYSTGRYTVVHRSRRIRHMVTDRGGCSERNRRTCQDFCITEKPRSKFLCYYEQQIKSEVLKIETRLIDKSFECVTLL